MNNQVAIIGRPNVGKSTLLNRLIGENKAITFNVPGTTRDPVVGTADWRNQTINLIDTAGLIDLTFTDPTQAKIGDILRESALIMVIVDAQAGLTAQDSAIVNYVRTLNRPLILVINKTDSKSDASYEFAKLGIDNKCAVSALHGSKTGDLLDLIVKIVGPRPAERKLKSDIKVAIVGRPNVGKSTLLNYLANRPVSLTDKSPGTTRDTVDIIIEKTILGRKVVVQFTDTAGIRRKVRISQGVEFYSFVRATRAISQSDIVLVLIDSQAGQTHQDTAIIRLALTSKKSVLVIYNKADLVENDEQLNYQRFRFIARCRSIVISLKTGRNLKLLDRVIDQTIADFIAGKPGS